MDSTTAPKDTTFTDIQKRELIINAIAQKIDSQQLNQWLIWVEQKPVRIESFKNSQIDKEIKTLTFKFATYVIKEDKKECGIQDLEIPVEIIETFTSFIQPKAQKYEILWFYPIDKSVPFYPGRPRTPATPPSDVEYPVWGEE